MRFVFAYALMLCAGAAQAGAWEEFERRCLVPMENVQEPVTEGLPLIAERIDQGFVHRGFRTEFHDVNLILTEDEVGELQSCAITVARSLPVEFVNTFLAQVTEKKNNSLSDGTYSEIDCSCAMLLHSNQTREPVLAIRLAFGAASDSWIISSEETDLES